jgi:hypothetical protein
MKPIYMLKEKDLSKNSLFLSQKSINKSQRKMSSNEDTDSEELKEKKKKSNHWKTFPSKNKMKSSFNSLDNISNTKNHQFSNQFESKTTIDYYPPSLTHQYQSSSFLNSLSNDGISEINIQNRSTSFQDYRQPLALLSPSVLFSSMPSHSYPYASDPSSYNLLLIPPFPLSPPYLNSSTSESTSPPALYLKSDSNLTYDMINPPNTQEKIQQPQFFSSTLPSTSFATYAQTVGYIPSPASLPPPPPLIMSPIRLDANENKNNHNFPSSPPLHSSFSYYSPPHYDDQDVSVITTTTVAGNNGSYYDSLPISASSLPTTMLTGIAVPIPANDSTPIQYCPGPSIITGDSFKGPRGCNLFVFHLPNEVSNWLVPCFLFFTRLTHFFSLSLCCLS